MDTADRSDPSRLRVGGWVRTQSGRRSTARRVDSTVSTARLQMVDEDEPDPPDRLDDLEQYRGRRRAPGMLGRRTQVAILAVLVLAGGGLLLRSFMPADPPGAVGVDVPGQLPAVTGAASDLAPSESAEPSLSPSASPSSSAEPSATDNASPSQIAQTVPPRAPVASYEAESGGNTLSGTAQVKLYAAASGGRVVTGLGGDAANTLRFNGVTASRAGSYTLTVYYVSPERRRASLEVNGTRAGTLEFTSTGGAVGSVVVTVTLQSGANTIQFGNARSLAPDIDRIAVR